LNLFCEARPWGGQTLGLKPGEGVAADQIYLAGFWKSARYDPSGRSLGS